MNTSIFLICLIFIAMKKPTETVKSLGEIMKTVAEPTFKLVSGRGIQFLNIPLCIHRAFYFLRLIHA